MLTELKISLEKAKQLYPTASNELKEIFESTWSKKEFIKDRRDIIKTWADVINLVGYPETPYSEAYGTDTLNKVQKSQNAFGKLCKLAEAYNGDDKVDINNTNQYKYYSYIYESNSGWRVDYYNSYDLYYYPVGILFLRKEDLIDALVKFPDVFWDYHMVNNISKLQRV